MPESGAPVYLRIGDNDEQELGRLDTAAAMPHLLRTAADHFERRLAVSDQTDDRTEET